VSEELLGHTVPGFPLYPGVHWRNRDQKNRVLSAGVGRRQQATYDLLITGGHVIDARNNVDAVRDVANEVVFGRASRCSSSCSPYGASFTC
jgi:hypothetical protein